MKVMTFFGAIISTVFNNFEMNVLMFKSLFNFNNDLEETKLQERKTSNKNFNKIIKDYSNDHQQNSKIILNNVNIYAKIQNPIKHMNTVSNNRVKLPEDNSKNNLTRLKINNEDFNYKIKDHKKSFTNRVKLNSFSYLQMNLCYICTKRDRNKFKLYNYACKKLVKYLDYLEIIKTLQQFHRIKKIIFNKTQDRLFSFYQRPVISLEKAQIEKDKTF
jgi:hypothetical protein